MLGVILFYIQQLETIIHHYFKSMDTREYTNNNVSIRKTLVEFALWFKSILLLYFNKHNNNNNNIFLD